MDQDKLQSFLGKAVNDLGAAFSAALMLIGDELGLYRELAKGKWTSAELAQRTSTNERYVREWLGNQAAGGYVGYDANSDKYFLDEAQALCLADPNGPVDLPGAYMLVQDLFHVLPRATANFRSGEGMEWGEHHRCLFHGTERFFRAGYNSNLLASWLPALDGVVEKLVRGGRAADIGCGHGASTILMAKAFPNSDFVGYDYHAASIDVAHRRAQEANIRNAHFEIADATNYAGRDFDFIAFFDCLHDMADPAGAARHAQMALKPDGHWYDRGAGGGRYGRAESQSRRPRVLRRVVYDLRSRLPGAKRSGTRCPSRRKAITRDRDIRRLHALPPGHRDPVQSRLRGASLAEYGMSGWRLNASVLPSLG
jgi:2-polyprenyl-3-methyl-5-hydroxy-6-metoxy-1,4-benzoquinol methylase